MFGGEGAEVEGGEVGEGEGEGWVASRHYDYCRNAENSKGRDGNGCHDGKRRVRGPSPLTSRAVLAQHRSTMEV